MKKKIGWIIGFAESIVGFALFIAAQSEISANSWYTWRPPYTSYEAEVIMMKWIGLALLISGVVWIGLKFYQIKFINKHTEDINQVTEKGGAIKCAGCGLEVAASVKTCPRCGKTIATNGAEENKGSFCGKCGNQVGKGQTYCPKCGNKIF